MHCLTDKGHTVSKCDQRTTLESTSWCNCTYGIKCGHSSTVENCDAFYFNGPPWNPHIGVIALLELNSDIHLQQRIMMHLISKDHFGIHIRYLIALIKIEKGLSSAAMDYKEFYFQSSPKYASLYLFKIQRIIAVKIPKSVNNC